MTEIFANWAIGMSFFLGSAVAGAIVMKLASLVGRGLKQLEKNEKAMDMALLLLFFVMVSTIATIAGSYIRG